MIQEPQHLTQQVDKCQDGWTHNVDNNK